MKRLIKVSKPKSSKNSKFNPDMAETALYMARGDFEDEKGKMKVNQEEVLDRALQYLEFLLGTHEIFNKKQG